ncbi:hypothetical protein GCM10010329_18650 [Streptomyces spiroverticillatus]|uniref:Uncharacterized protein n=1 Tax=Streptomyces finlayi TaxID=67296 RepID=A0A919C7Z1_9ACTN|nr:hypothetical protein [Streptomyces finlayi]GGZ97607.1 hypothetical protein GCM10010329_18650 [Streptomyces spiroverticillatus]GHC82697.1 hypothetical protein GCM10010334_11130 [Streptomyces finlayi]
MSGAQTPQQTQANAELTKLALINAMLMVVLAVSMTSLEGTLRTIVGSTLGFVIIICAGYTGAAYKRSKRQS